METVRLKRGLDTELIKERKMNDIYEERWVYMWLSKSMDFMQLRKNTLVFSSEHYIICIGLVLYWCG